MTGCDPFYLMIFLPAVMLLYSLVPARRRPHILLLANYISLWIVSGALSLFLMASTLLLHYYGLWHGKLTSEQSACIAEDRDNRKQIKSLFAKKQKLIVVFFALIHIGILAVLKYSAFFLGNVNTLLALLPGHFAVEIPHFAMPLGISFYTFQAVSYTIDVYRGKLKPDNNLLKLALYMSFFPQMTEGPICRFADTADALMRGEAIRADSAYAGYLRILWGVIKKVVVADRLNILVKTVFEGHEKYDGGIIALGVICYTCQLYMDFSGVMDVVLGSGKIFGVAFPENFRQPFFSKTISEFWKRWHITLGTWFKDYIFFPVSMSKPIKKLTVRLRKKLGNRYGPVLAGSFALLCVWLANGLWHGAAWNYVFFGIYHFILIFVGGLLEPLFALAAKKFSLNREHPVVTGGRILKTTFFVCIGELFFRAETVQKGFAMLGTFFTRFSLRSFGDGTVFSLGLDGWDFVIVGVVCCGVLAVSILKERKKDVSDYICTRHAAIRFVIFYALVLFAVIFGAYGDAYTPVDPMYAGF